MGKIPQILRKRSQKERNKDTPYKELESCTTLLYASLSFCGDSFLERALLFRGPYDFNPFRYYFASNIGTISTYYYFTLLLHMCHVVILFYFS